MSFDAWTFKNEIPKNKAWREDKRKMGHLSSYHVYSQSYGHEYVKNSSFFLFSANDSKKLVTVWAKYLSAPARSH